MNEEPPFIGWYVVEVDIASDREHELFTSIRGPYSTEQKAKRERDQQQEAWERALERWDDTDPYDFKGWDIVKKHLTEFQIGELERQDEESHRIMMDAVNAVGEGLLAKEGIEPFGENDE